MKKLYLLSCILFLICLINSSSAQTPGTLKWRYETGNMIESSPAISEDGTIYVGSYDDYLYAINPDGTLKWRYQTGNNVESSPAIGSDGTVYVGSWDHYLYAVNPDGTLKWRYQTESLIRPSPAIGGDGTVYVGSWKDLYAINSDGTLKWRYQTGEYAIESSPAIGSDGTVYVGSWDHYLFAVNPDGTLKWSYQAESDVNSSPAIGIDGTVYVGSWDHYLYAIYSESQGLSAGPWPKFHQNNRNTGSSPSVAIFDQMEFIFFNTGEIIRKTFTVSNPFSTDITLNNCLFDHNAFFLDTPLPMEILAGAASTLTTTIRPNNQGLYQSTCQITYETNDESKNVSNEIQAGLFLEDGSESSVTAHRVLDAYNICLSDESNSAAVKNNLGVLYRLLGEPDVAERELMGALSQGQGELHGYSGIKMNVGVVKSDQDSAALARQYYHVAMIDVVDSENESSLAPQIYYNKAWEAYTRNDPDSADVFINRTIGHAKANDFLKAKAYVLRGAIYYQSADELSAASDFQQAMALDPDGPIGRMALDNLDFLTGVEELTDKNIPMTFVLTPNYPNPFNPETTISFGLPRESNVTLEVYNIRGQRIRMLITKRLKAGWHHVTWNGMDDLGRQVGSGIYFIQMRAGEFESTHKMSLLK